MQRQRIRKLVNTKISKQGNPKVLVISQWPKIKNAEYQLIEKIKKTALDITVVDYLGFKVDTGECINNSALSKNYDFAISLHFETPKLLNIPMYAWISNPLEFLYLQPHYATVILHNMRSYDGYLFNGSSPLEHQISNLLGTDRKGKTGMFYPSVSETDISSPSQKRMEEAIPKLFYCGINWERIHDAKSRDDGFYLTLQKQNIIDFYGPKIFNNKAVWKGFHAYQNEIPFHGNALRNTMQKYTAVLAFSSPAHLKSQTSSSRVFEGIAAGVPVISDKNLHVQKTFGDSVYYYEGKNNIEAVKDIQKILREIKEYPEEAKKKVILAQKFLREKYSFEKCLKEIFRTQINLSNHAQNKTQKKPAVSGRKKQFHILLFHHDPTGEVPIESAGFENFEYCIVALERIEDYKVAGKITVFAAKEQDLSKLKKIAAKSNVTITFILLDQLGINDWNNTKLGKKISTMIPYAEDGFVSFINTFEYPHYDYFLKQVTEPREKKIINVAGLFFNDLKESVSKNNNHVQRFNKPVASYPWSIGSSAEHSLGAITYPIEFLKDQLINKVDFFDFLLPILTLFLAEKAGYKIHRSQFMSLRVNMNMISKGLETLQKIKLEGFWPQHYRMVSNFDHEVNAGYDYFYNDANLYKRWKEFDVHSDVHSATFIAKKIERIHPRFLDLFLRIIDFSLPIYLAFRKYKSYLQLSLMLPIIFLKKILRRT